MTFTIREMKEGDEHGIANVHVNSWNTTYRGVVPQSYLDRLQVREQEQKWKTILYEYPGQSNYGLVAVNAHSEIVGFAICDRAEDKEPVEGELNAIYILEGYQQHGIGRALLRHVLANFREKGWERFMTVALVDNPSFPFYEKLNPHYLRLDTWTVDDVDLQEWVMTFHVSEVKALL